MWLSAGVRKKAAGSCFSAQLAGSLKSSPKAPLKDYSGTRTSEGNTGRDGFEDLCVSVEPAKPQAQLIHGVRPRIQEPPEGGHIVHQLYEDGHVVIAHC
jgi:hypothetical protein